MRPVEVPPNASALIESMRDIGYTLDTALADIIDNSITAGARNIELLVSPGGDLRLAVVDDGHGMSEAELLDAMRPGSRNPLEERGADDLGRFGLGLKTASFSQCRQLTVFSRRDGISCAATWDLDEVARTNAWTVLVHDEPENVPWADRLSERDGTLVLWEMIDRLGGDDGSAAGREHAVSHIDEARQHLELVFHRFLGARGKSRVKISLNGTPLKPFDPFHEDHPATMAGPVEVIRLDGRDVEVQAFTLPHHQHVTKDEWEYFAGRDGYLRSQGFYIYRGRRLILHGTWFRLARQMELTKLARVRIDMPNDLDADWKIDVLKSSAQPPRQVRERLKGIIDQIAGSSKRVYTKRGAKLTSDNQLPVWHRIQDKGEIRYRLNDEHPALADFESRLGDDLVRDFRRVMEIVASGVPFDALIADLSGSPKSVNGHAIDSDALRYAVETAVERLRSVDASPTDIPLMLRQAEPFRSNWDESRPLVEAMLGDPDRAGD